MSIDDLFVILVSEKPSIGLKASEKELFDLIPEFKSCKGFNQNNVWHIYDVYEHILHVVDNVSPSLVIRLAALFHDLGKPFSYTEDENGVGHFYGHWEVSQKIFDLFASKYNIDKDISLRVSNLIYYHDVNISKLSDENLSDLIKKVGLDGIKQLYELKMADLLAQNEKFHYILDDYENQKNLILSKYRRC